jgi:soluble lytic murein transglycosylase-like protein
MLSLLSSLVIAERDNSVYAKQWTDKYDRYFKKYTKHYFGPGVDWHWFKSQAITESSLNPNAVGAAGEIGLMQVKPSTFEYIKTKNPYFLELKDPRWNIASGVFYVRYLYHRWSKKLGAEQRLLFSFASYNAGFGGMSKALRRAKRKQGKINKWEQVINYAPKITRRYVSKIRSLMKKD